MNRLSISIAIVLVLTAIATPVLGCSSTSKQESKSLTISETKGGDGMVVTMSEALAHSLLEGVVGAGLQCGADIDSDFAALRLVDSIEVGYSFVNDGDKNSADENTLPPITDTDEADSM